MLAAWRMMFSRDRSLPACFNEVVFVYVRLSGRANGGKSQWVARLLLFWGLMTAVDQGRQSQQTIEYFATYDTGL
jgi:hypothetical protein